jgi:Na+-driven multidrug efflux pump
MGDKHALVAIGLGNATINVFVVAMYLGLNSAASTFVAQALGFGHDEVCGIYLWRGRFIYTAAMMVIVPIFMNAKAILVAMG